MPPAIVPRSRRVRKIIELAAAMAPTLEVGHATMISVQAALADDRRLAEIGGVITPCSVVSRLLAALHVEPG